MTIEYQRLVEDIQTLLSADSDPTEVALKEAYQRYVDAITQTNVRLEDCDRLLNQGLRAEAIHKSEMEPNLLDVTGVLDFPEREVWADFVLQYGLPEPPELKLDVALDLNEAYGDQEPLTRLIRAHRLYALNRSPLRPRIEVMRKIRQLDAGNPIWEQDIRTFERARIAQVAAEVGTAAKSDDVRTLQSLQQEISSGDWLESPPQQLISQVAKAHHAVQVKHARAELRKIAAELNEAYGNFEVDRARGARERWNKYSAIGIQDGNDELLEEVGPALDWLDEQDQKQQAEAAYNAAIRDLERALDKGASRQDLDRLYHAVLKFDRGIPDLLAKRLRERAASLETSERRKTRLTVAGVAASVILVAAGVTWLLISQNRQAEQERHVDNLWQLIKAEKLVEAEAYLTNLADNHEAVYESAEIQELKSELEGLQKQENSRKAEWDQHIANARRLGIDEFTWSSTHDAERVLKRARDISATDRERSAVDLLRDEIITFRSQKQSELDQAFSLEFVNFQEKFNARDPSDEDEIQGLITQARGLQAKWPKDQSNVEPFVEQLQSNLDTISLLKEEAELAESVTLAVGDRKEFASKLQDYVDNSPLNESRKSDFRKVLASEPTLWQGVELWNELIADWSKLDLTAVEPAAAKSLVQRANSLLNDHPGFPGEAKLKQLVGYLESVAQRDASKRELAALFGALNSTQMKDLKALVTMTGQRYYFLDKAPLHFPNNDEWRVYYFSDFTYKDPESTTIESKRIANRKTADGQYDWTSPQSDLATFILQELQLLRAENWNAKFEAILTKLKQDENVEPVLRIQLIDMVLGVAVQGDAFLPKALNNHVLAIENSGVDYEANWIDPNDSEGRRVSAKARSVIQGLTDFGAAFAKAEENYESLKMPNVGHTHQWIGWLKKDADQQWVCARPPAPEGAPYDETGELCVILKEPSGSRATEVPVGTIQDGLDTELSESAWVEGRPVFLQVQGRTPTE